MKVLFSTIFLLASYFCHVQSKQNYFDLKKFCTRNILLSGIECWACSTDGFDPDMHSECIDDPEIGRKVTCSSDQTHCYVTRILSPGPRN